MSVAQQAVDAFGGVDESIPVRAFNRSDQDVIWEYAQKKYHLPARQTTGTYVPYMAMVYWQGDPRAIDVPGGRLHLQHRRRERSHLEVLYGVYENAEKWADIPLIECYPIDSDVRFETVIHDPDGLHLTDQTTGMSEVAALKEMAARQAAQLQAMQAHIASLDQQTAAISAAGIDPDAYERQETDVRGVAPEAPSGSMVGPAPVRKMAAKGGKASRDEGEPVTRDGE